MNSSLPETLKELLDIIQTEEQLQALIRILMDDHKDPYSCCLQE